MYKKELLVISDVRPFSAEMLKSFISGYAEKHYKSIKENGYGLFRINKN